MTSHEIEELVARARRPDTRSVRLAIGQRHPAGVHPVAVLLRKVIQRLQLGHRVSSPDAHTLRESLVGITLTGTTSVPAGRGSGPVLGTGSARCGEHVQGTTRWA